MLPDTCGSSLLSSLPDDLFSVITRPLSPRDVCSLGLSCRCLHALVASDKVWLAQCEKLGLLTCNTLLEWRKGVSSYMALCHFMVTIHPLTGIWVHQNPELGNLVYVMPGFLSFVGCRIIPQEVGPLGLEEGPILYTPVFEILCDQEGSPEFLLHGRERGVDYVYPGVLKSVDRNCNMLLLEVEPRHSDDSQRAMGQKGSRVMMPFSRLGFGVRRRLLEVVTNHVRKTVPDKENSLLFPRSRNNELDLKHDLARLHERRFSLLEMYKLGNGDQDLNPFTLGLSEVCKILDCAKAGDGDHDQSHSTTKGKMLSGFLKNSLKQILGKSSHDIQKNSNKQAQLHEFLQSGDMIGLALCGTATKLSSYRTWPNMHDSRFALYKLPVRAPEVDHVYAGLWGGTFGWPPGKPSEDKPGKALFFILISYEESQGQRLLIATKILEGTSYVLYPNGSAMFMVNMDQLSADTFPWETDRHIDVKESYVGEGIANGYGFRYPGSKPGTLFVIENGLLVFIWKESRAVLTLQRLVLEDLLRKGERVPSLTPIYNFAYLTKTYSNVYSGFSTSSNTLSSPRLAMKN